MPIPPNASPTIPPVLPRFNLVAFGAKIDGKTDDTAAVQNAFDAAANSPGGGIVEHPGGYCVITQLSLTGPGSVVVEGVGDTIQGLGTPVQGSAFLWDSPSVVENVITINSSAQTTFRRLSLSPLIGPDSSGAGYVAFLNLTDSLFEDIHIGRYSGGAATTGILAQGSGRTIVNRVRISAWTNAIWMSGGQLLTVRDAILSQVPGQNGSAIRMDNGAQTLRISNSQSQGGDRGLYLPSGSGTAPAFVFMNDFEINNPQVAGCDLQAGSQVYGTNVWMSAAGNASTVNAVGLNVGASFNGDLYLANSQLQDWNGGAANIAGTGVYQLNGCEIGGSGSTVADLVVNNSNAVVHCPNSNFGTDAYYGATGKNAIERLAGSVDYHGASFGSYSGGALAGCTPTVAALAANGTSPPAPTISGNDTAGVVQFGSGTAPALGPQVQVTFAAAKTTTPVVIAGPYAASDSYWQGYVVPGSVTTTGFQYALNTAPSAGEPVGTMAFSYLVSTQ